MSLPVELIVTTKAHHVASSLADVPAGQRAAARERATEPAFLDTLARDLLIAIARDATPSRVWAALAACGGPSSAAEYAQRIRAAEEAQHRDAGRHGSEMRP